MPDLYFKPSAYTAVLFTGKRKNYKHLILNTSAIMQCNNSNIIILIIIINNYNYNIGVFISAVSQNLPKISASAASKVLQLKVSGELIQRRLKRMLSSEKRKLHWKRKN